MKILIINPNSSSEMTEAIDRTAKKFAAGEYEVITLPTQGAPMFIDSYQDKAAALPGMMNIVREYENDVDAFIIACHCDPNIEVIREMTDKLVVGIGEASIKMASMLGHKFSVVSTGKSSIPNKEAMIHGYHLSGALASVRSPKNEDSGWDNEALLTEAAMLAIEEDMAEVIVLGCAGMCEMVDTMKEKLKVPVLDGVVCALIIASGMVKAGIATSKIRRYCKT